MKKTIYIRGGASDSEAVRVMVEHLNNLGHLVTRRLDKPHDVILCWGVSTRELAAPKPALNSHVNFYNKCKAMDKFKEVNLRIPQIIPATLDMVTQMRFVAPFPWFGRLDYHEKANDIEVAYTYQEAVEMMRTKSFFSVYIPTRAEYRVWTFRERALAVYKKEYAGPGLVPNRPDRKHLEDVVHDEMLEQPDLCRQACIATTALGMDFGAVDMLEGKDGQFYVLEVNSQPEILTTKRLSGIRLSKRVSAWAEAL